MIGITGNFFFDWPAAGVGEAADPPPVRYDGAPDDGEPAENGGAPPTDSFVDGAGVEDVRGWAANTTVPLSSTGGEAGAAGGVAVAGGTGAAVYGSVVVTPASAT
jgi:hypothetical protein